MPEAAPATLPDGEGRYSVIEEVIIGSVEIVLRPEQVSVRTTKIGVLE